MARRSGGGRPQTGRRGSADSDRRLTKAERKEQARREREEIRKRMARRKRNRTIGISLVSVAAAAVVLVVVIVPRGQSGLHSASDLLQQASTAEKQAACTPVKTIGPYGGVTDSSSPNYLDRYHIGATAVPTPPPLSTYPSVPPASGPHAPVTPGPMPAGIYTSPPDIYRAIHSLEHGATIVWYDPSISGSELDQLTAFFGQRVSEANVDQSRVLVAPYDYPSQGKAGHLPAGVQMAVVAWHHLMTCGRVSLAAAFDFSSQYSYPPYDGRKYLGDAPEAGGAL